MKVYFFCVIVYLQSINSSYLVTIHLAITKLKLYYKSFKQQKEFNNFYACCPLYLNTGDLEFFSRIIVLEAPNLQYLYTFPIRQRVKVQTRIMICSPILQRGRNSGGTESPASFSALNHRRFYTLLAVAMVRVRAQLFSRPPIL